MKAPQQWGVDTLRGVCRTRIWPSSQLSVSAVSQVRHGPVHYTAPGASGQTTGPLRTHRRDDLWSARWHLPALGHPVPAAVVTGGTHGHLLTAQCPWEADPEVLGIAELGFGLRDLQGNSQATGGPGPDCPPLRNPPGPGRLRGCSPASPTRLQVSSPAVPACPVAASPQTQGCEGSPWGSRSPG